MVDVYVRQGKPIKEINRATCIAAAVALAKPRLREIVARLLSHSDTGTFMASEVSVQTHFLDASTDPLLDVECRDSMTCDVQIVINAKWYPWLDEMKDILARVFMAEYSEMLPVGATAWVAVNPIRSGTAIWPPKLTP